jgi:hypothetical protein
MEKTDPQTGRRFTWNEEASLLELGERMDDAKEFGNDNIPGSSKDGRLMSVLSSTCIDSGACLPRVRLLKEEQSDG